MALTHNSTLAKTEPAWKSVDKSRLPRNAHALMGPLDDTATWGFAHHFVVDGKTGGEHGVYVEGQMFLHREGLCTAMASQRLALSTNSDVKAHLARHGIAIGMSKKEIAELMGVSLSETYEYLEIGGENYMDDLEKALQRIKDLETRSESLETRLEEKDKKIEALTQELKEKNEQIGTLEQQVVESDARADSLNQLVEGYTAEEHFTKAGKEAIENLRAEITKIQAQVDGNDFDKELFDKQLNAFGDDLSALTAFKSSIEKRREKIFKTGSIDPDPTQNMDEGAKAKLDKYNLGRIIGAGSSNVVPIKQ